MPHLRCSGFAGICFYKDAAPLIGSPQVTTRARASSSIVVPKRLRLPPVPIRNRRGMGGGGAGWNWRPDKH